MEHEQQMPFGTWRALDTLVDEVVSTRRQIAALQAREAELMGRAVELVVTREEERREAGLRFGNDLPLREVSSELGAAMRLSDRSVQTRMGRASLLLDRFAATHAALGAGEIDETHAHVIVDAGCLIADDDKRADYERRALSAARTETPHRLGKIARVLAGRIDPEGTAESIRHAQDERMVRLIDLPDGIARLILDLPAVLAHAIFDRATAMARQLTRETIDASADAASDPSHAIVPVATRGDGVRAGNAPADDSAMDERGDVLADGSLITGPSQQAGTDDQADPRTMNQKRADLLADILLTGSPAGHGADDALGAIRAKVQITVPVLTLLGHSKSPALLAGHGPIDLETAKRLAADAPGWDRVLTDPYSGEPLAVDRYRPSAALARFLDTRDEHCRFPGCIQPPWRCDHDHTQDAAYGGPTSKDNLANFCRRHHTLKHHSPWRVEQLGHGRLRWTSPTGRRYTDTPIGVVQFVPEPPPF